MICAICGKNSKPGIFGSHIHHFILQQQFKRDREFFDREKINQKEIILCHNCHDALHHRSEETFLDEEIVDGITRSQVYYIRSGRQLKKIDFLFDKKKYIASITGDLGY